MGTVESVGGAVGVRTVLAPGTAVVPGTVDPAEVVAGTPNGELLAGTEVPDGFVGTNGGGAVNVVAGIPPDGGSGVLVPGKVGKPPVGIDVELGMAGF
jgi:hypothetical protein